MSALAEQQQALLGALLSWPPDQAEAELADQVTGPWTRGLKAYQANGHALAQRALGASYPVLAQLLGADSFAALARAFWHAHPPVRGDVTQWGGDLAEYLAHSDQLRDDPYLPDVARVEWALHRCACASDAQADAATFALLMAVDPAQLKLRLAPGCVLLPSGWPVASIMSAHLEGTPDFSEVGSRLAAGIAETALVWREGLRARVRLAVPGEEVLLAALLAGRPLGAALEGTPELDFSTWLEMAARTGLLLAVEAIGDAPPQDTGDIT